MTAIDALKKQPLFSWISNTPLEYLVKHAETRSLNPGDVLYEAGSPGDAVFLILGGEIEFHAEGKAVAALGSGDLFGECSLIEVKERACDAKAAEKSTVLVLSHELLYRFSKEYPDPYSIIITNLARCLAAHIRDQNEKKASLAENRPKPAGVANE